MGCYNVSCSVSRLSIGAGQKIAFIPLLSKMKDYQSPETPATNLVSNDGCYIFYNAFSYPVFGEYNDYGGIEEIEENITTKAIEEYFGVSIEAFFEAITGRPDPYEAFSGTGPLYVDKDLLEAINSYESRIKVGPKFLKMAGLEKQKDGSWMHPLVKEVRVRLVPTQESSADKARRKIAEKEGKEYKKPRSSAKGYVIETKGDRYLKYGDDGFSRSWDASKGVKIDDEWKIKAENTDDEYDTPRSLLMRFQEIANFYLGVSDEGQVKYNLISKIGGMFVLREVYDHLSHKSIGEYGDRDGSNLMTDSYNDEYVLQLAGFEYVETNKDIERYNKMYKHPSSDKYLVGSDGTWMNIYEIGNNKEIETNGGVYHPSDLQREWFQLTDYTLEWPEISTHEKNFRMAMNEVSQLKNYRINDDNIKDELQKIKENDSLSQEEKEKKVEQLLEDYSDYLSLRRDRSESKLARIQPGDYRLTRSYNPIGDLYKAEYSRELELEHNRWQNFYWNCFGNNIFFFPAIGGYQHGSSHSEKYLHDKISEITAARIAEYEEEVE